MNHHLSWISISKTSGCFGPKPHLLSLLGKPLLKLRGQGAHVLYRVFGGGAVRDPFPKESSDVILDIITRQFGMSVQCLLGLASWDQNMCMYIYIYVYIIYIYVYIYMYIYISSSQYKKPISGRFAHGKISKPHKCVQVSHFWGNHWGYCSRMRLRCRSFTGKILAHICKGSADKLACTPISHTFSG